MADTKITALTALTAADPANDVIPIVDVSDTTMAASGTTKKISVNNILGASGTATLASATITGAATVGTTLGVTGVSTFAAGTALLPALTTTGDTNTGIYYPAADTFAVTTGGTERYRVDSSGNVGIGVTPSAWGTYKGLQVGYASLAGYAGSDTFLGSNVYFDGGAFRYISTATASNYRQLSGVHQWNIAPSGTAGNSITFTQAMTLDASGNLLVGTTSLIAGSASGSLNIVGDNTQQIQIRNSSAAAGQYWRQAVDSSNTIYILNNASTGVSITSGATSWSAVSDERLKDIIEPIGNAVAKVGSLRSVIGKYKSDSEGTRRSFLIAQDVQSVLPEAVDTTNADAFGVRYSEVIPLLVAAIKELTARVQTLETR